MDLVVVTVGVVSAVGMVVVVVVVVVIATWPTYEGNPREIC